MWTTVQFGMRESSDPSVGDSIRRRIGMGRNEELVYFGSYSVKDDAPISSPLQSGAAGVEGSPGLLKNYCRGLARRLDDIVARVSAALDQDLSLSRGRKPVAVIQPTNPTELQGEKGGSSPRSGKSPPQTIATESNRKPPSTGSSRGPMSREELLGLL